MTEKNMRKLLSLPIPDPYLVNATDKYYGVTSASEEKEIKDMQKSDKKTRRGHPVNWRKTKNYGF